jgi:chromosome segregation ATPase
MNTEIRRLKEWLTKSGVDKEDIEKMNNELNNDVGILSKTILEAKQEVSEVKTKMMDKEKELEASRADIKQAKQLLANYEIDAERFLNNLSDQELEVRELNRKLETTLRSKLTTDEENNKMIVKIKDLDEQIKLKDEAIQNNHWLHQKLQEDLNSANSDIEDLTQQNYVMKNTIVKMNQKKKMVEILLMKIYTEEGLKAKKVEILQMKKVRATKQMEKSAL